MQSGVRKTLPVGSRSRTNIPGGSTAPVSEDGAKKRSREVDSEDVNLDSGVAKRMRPEKVFVQGTQPCDSPPLTRCPSAELQNGGKVRAEYSPPICSGEDKATPVVGSDDYTGALFGSGDSDQGVEGQFEGRGISPSAGLSCPSSPANNADVKSSLSPRKYALLCVIHVASSLAIQLDLLAHVLLEPPQHERNYRSFSNNTIFLPDLMLPKFLGLSVNL